MMQTIQDFNLLPQTIQSNCGVTNVFNGTTASPSQSHDLLNFRKIGYDSNMDYIKHRLLKYQVLQHQFANNICSHLQSDKSIKKE